MEGVIIDGPGDEAAVKSCETMEESVVLPRRMEKMEVFKERGIRRVHV